MSERCVRCGEEGEDRRTLWHSCMYAMNELNVPFEEVRVTGHVYAKTGIKELLPSLMAPTFSNDPSREFNGVMFTLRVCKKCRSDWMSAIERWFNNVQPVQRAGTGIFVRKNGATVEVTYAEWEKMRGD